MTDTTTAASPDWDVLIVGRSFAGLSAALTLGRARRSVIVVGSGGPRNEAVEHAHGLLTRDHESPGDLIATAEAQLARYPNVELADDRVLGIEAVSGTGFRASIGKRSTTAATVVLATGANDDPLPIPGLAEHWGRGVYTCPFCDGWEHQDLHLAVVGEPEFVPHLAGVLTNWTDRVTVFGVELDTASRAALAGRGVVVEDRAVRRVIGDGAAVTAVELIDGDVVEVGALFHARLPIPNAGLAVALGCSTGPYGFVVVDETCRTDVDGVWAVGDLARRAHQMAFAIADGVTAGSQIVGRLIG